MKENMTSKEIRKRMLPSKIIKKMKTKATLRYYFPSAKLMATEDSKTRQWCSGERRRHYNSHALLVAVQLGVRNRYLPSNNQDGLLYS